MKKFILTLMLTAGIISPLMAQDLRTACREAADDYAAARQESKVTREEILGDRNRLTQAVHDLETEVTAMGKELSALDDELTTLNKRQAELAPARRRVESELGSLAATVRVIAQDLQGQLNQSCFTALDPDSLDALDDIVEDRRFPGMGDLGRISDLARREMEQASAVSIHEGLILDGHGQKIPAEIFTAGRFLTAWRADGDVGLLNYAPGSHELVMLSSPAPRNMRRNLDRYIAGRTDSLWIDLSGGAALRQLVHRPTFKKQLQQGGFLVWPILLLGAVSAVLGGERILSLRRIHQDTDALMDRINEHAAAHQWQECDTFLARTKDGPVTRILQKGLASRTADRESLENVLQEAILRELPSLERFLPTINILGAIAPLLGLLGTVSGMICTFQVITLHGTGDPRIMSGGISEALITTELGLAMAIPIMLLHTFLSRRVDHIAGDMEEKAVALSNTLSRCGEQS